MSLELEKSKKELEDAIKNEDLDIKTPGLDRYVDHDRP